MARYKPVFHRMGVPLLGKIDGRTKPAKRWKQHYEHLIELAEKNGPVTEVERQLCRRAASLMLLAERNEARLLEGKDVDELAYVRLSGAIARALRALSIGIDEAFQEKPDPGPSIHELMGRHDA